MKKKKIIILAIVVLGIGYTAYSCFLKKSKVDDIDSVMNEASVSYADINSQISGKGVLNPEDSYIVKTQVNGKIYYAPFKEGDLVKKGDVLFKVDKNIINSEIKNADIGFKKSKESYRQVEEQRDDLNIRTPFKGRVTDILIKKGDMVSQGQDIAKIDDNSSYIIGAYFDRSVGNVRVGENARLTIDATGESIDGKVTSVSNKSGNVMGVPAIRVNVAVNNNGNININKNISLKINGINAISIDSVESNTSFSVKSKASGIVDDILVNKMDLLKKDQVIARITSKEVDRGLRNAGLDLEVAKNNYKAEKEKLKNYTIKAPISGTIVKLNKKKGDVVDPSIDGQNGLATIFDMSSMKLIINVDELDILKVKKGDNVEVVSNAIPDKKYDAKVENIGIKGTVSGGTTTYPVTVVLKDYGRLLPGMNVSCKIDIASKKHVLTVPLSCVQRGDYVYVKENGVKIGKNETNPDNPLIPAGYKKVKVETGISDSSLVEIKSGLKEGDIVYMQGEVGGGQVDMGGDQMDMGGDQMDSEGQLQ